MDIPFKTLVEATEQITLNSAKLDISQSKNQGERKIASK